MHCVTLSQPVKLPFISPLAELPINTPLLCPSALVSALCAIDNQLTLRPSSLAVYHDCEPIEDEGSLIFEGSFLQRLYALVSLDHTERLPHVKLFTNYQDNVVFKEILKSNPFYGLPLPLHELPLPCRVYSTPENWSLQRGMQEAMKGLLQLTDPRDAFPKKSAFRIAFSAQAYEPLQKIPKETFQYLLYELPECEKLLFTEEGSIIFIPSFADFQARRSYTLSLSKQLSILDSCDLVVGAYSIWVEFAAVLGLPFLGLGGHQKMRSMLGSINGGYFLPPVAYEGCFGCFNRQALNVCQGTCHHLRSLDPEVIVSEISYFLEMGSWRSQR